MSYTFAERPAGSGGLLVSSAARVSGAVADAVVRVDADEHRRRVEVGLAGVVDHGVLDALMCLPEGVPVSAGELGEVTRWHLGKAPEGCVQWIPGGLVRRLLVPVCSVELVVVPSTWRPGLRRAAEFEPFAARVVCLPRLPRNLAQIEWEADASGVGLWLTQPSGRIDEVVPPARFVRRFVKPAGWRFSERAYAAWTSSREPAEALGHDGLPTPPTADGTQTRLFGPDAGDRS